MKNRPEVKEKWYHRKTWTAYARKKEVLRQMETKKRQSYSESEIDI